VGRNKSWTGANVEHLQADYGDIDKQRQPELGRMTADEQWSPQPACKLCTATKEESYL